VVEAADPPLRNPVGAQAHRLVAERRSVDDAAHEALVRRLLGEDVPVAPAPGKVC